MSRLSISSSFLVYCRLRCSLDGHLVKSCLKKVQVQMPHLHLQMQMHLSTSLIVDKTEPRQFKFTFKAKLYAISSDTHQLQFIKLHHFNFRLNSQCMRRLTWSPKRVDSTNQKPLPANAHAHRDVFQARLT